MSSLDQMQMDKIAWPWIQGQQQPQQGDAAPEPESQPEPEPELNPDELGCIGPDGFWRPYPTDKMPMPEE